MAEFDPEDYDVALAAPDQTHQRVDEAPALQQRIGSFTVVCLVLNRVIGSGIFVTPVNVLNGTGSIGIALIFWTLGGIVAACGLLVWLELGLSIPFRDVQVFPRVWEQKSVPRSGGEKNYLEYIYASSRNGKPRFLATCVYGIAFLALGNLSGNAMAFGTYVMTAAGATKKVDENGVVILPKGNIIAVAISGTTIAVFLHMFSRRGGIFINNFFAILKVLLILSMILMGLLQGWGVKIGSGPSDTDNKNYAPGSSMKPIPGNNGNVSDYSSAFLYVMYSYVGFEQPFYVLSEVKRPRKVFPRFTLLAVFISTVLYVLMNVAYFCVVPKPENGKYLKGPDMATVFFQNLFDNDTAERVMAAVIAFSILGNIVVMTFTACRVKQEIAKEGILPFSLFFATGSTTISAWIYRRWHPLSPGEDPPEQEKTPMATLGLHWLSCVILIGLTSWLTPDNAYFVLISLYCFAIILLNGFLVSGGLLFLKLRPSRQWRSIANIKFWTDPLHVIIYFLVYGFLLFSVFKKPAYQFSKLPWWIVPSVGLSVLAWGFIWWLGLKLVMLVRRKDLVVNRVTLVVPDPGVPGQYLQKSEVIRHEWHAKDASRRNSFSE